MTCKKVYVSLPMDVIENMKTVKYRSTYLAHLAQAQRARIASCLDVIHGENISRRKSKEAIKALSSPSYQDGSPEGITRALRTEGIVMPSVSDEYLKAIFEVALDVRYGRFLSEIRI